MEMEFTPGLMAGLTKVPGKIIICMVREYTLGVMEGNMMESIIWTKSMVMEYTSGLMAEDMRGIGPMGNSMEKANICFLMV